MHELWTGALLGCALGLRHAVEPDHVAAITTLLPGTAGTGLRLGALWGLGHALPVVLLGGILVIAGAELPAPLADLLELAVAAMLLWLGWRALGSALQGHAHPHPHPHRARPLAIGLVHGLAGTGALTAMVVTRFSTDGARLSYLVLFAVGSTAAMAAFSAAVATGLGRLVRQRIASAGAGFASLAAALYVAWSVLAR